MKCTIFVRLFATTLMWVFFSVPFQPQLARGENAPATIGKELFQAKCSPCHTIGGGRSVGPDLKGVTAIRDHAWLARFIPAPDHVLASGDQVANELLKEFGGLVMPDLGLTQTQVDELIAYLAESAPQASAPQASAPQASAPQASAPQTSAPQTSAPQTSAPQTSTPRVAATIAATGDPQRGTALFTGIIPFLHGGAPCLDCHTVSGVAPLGGGTLGPDLTGIHTLLGEDELASVLATLPFPTMRPIYQTRPLTQTEQGDLAALFRITAERPPVNASLLITVLAITGCVLLLLLAGVVWRKRLRSVRRTFVTTMTLDKR